MSVRIKICGITSLVDAQAAVQAGADALGFVFYPQSPRYIAPAGVATIVRALPPFIAKVGLFVDCPAEEVRQIVSNCSLDTLQFHGEETPDYCKSFMPGVKILKAFRVRDARSLDVLPSYETDAWLLDSFVPGQPGGTGQTFNWALAMEARLLGRPVVLSGGLTIDNVGEAVRRVRPFAVDVSTGVEALPGKKDPARMSTFIRMARGG